MSTVNLSTKFCGLTLKNPILLASGTCGYGAEIADITDINILGGIVVKGISIRPKTGNPPPRIVETPSGLLNAIGLENVGLEAFLRDKLPWLCGLRTHIFVNILGDTPEEYAELASVLSEQKGISALEVNISCPNVKSGGVAFGTDPFAAAEVTRAVKEAAKLPVIVKLSPNVTDITVIARAVEQAGADAVSLINTLSGMAIDIQRRRPVLANIFGGLSGPAIKPVALRMVWQTARAVSIPVIGIGGIVRAADALEFLMAGAAAVQIGTATLINPKTGQEIITGIENYMKQRGLTELSGLRIS
ncbi:MAG: dihydroorotate dehydrogenase [Deltaproteobacteria bacterium]|nr:dihydroorotate dehydrogenase [Deltaproteobacteria bacterium]